MIGSQCESSDYAKMSIRTKDVRCDLSNQGVCKKQNSLKNVKLALPHVFCSQL
jgi:hypothetical protein